MRRYPWSENYQMQMEVIDVLGVIFNTHNRTGGSGPPAPL